MKVSLSLKTSKRGFSLVEVAISLAIAATGFIALLGLLPQGMEMSRQTSEIAATNRIVERISGELLQTSWDQLDWTGYRDGAEGSRYFDDQGVELEPNSANFTQALTYTAKVYLAPDAAASPSVRLPASTPDDNPYMRKAWVSVTANSSGNVVFLDPSVKDRRFRHYPVIVPEMGMPTR